MSQQPPAKAPAATDDSTPQRARHDPADQAEQIAHTFARVLPTLIHATSLITSEQRDFLNQIAAKKKVSGWACFFIEAAVTEADARLLRRALLSIPDHFMLNVSQGEKP